MPVPAAAVPLVAGGAAGAGAAAGAAGAAVPAGVGAGTAVRGGMAANTAEKLVPDEAEGEEEQQQEQQQEKKPTMEEETQGQVAIAQQKFANYKAQQDAEAMQDKQIQADRQEGEKNRMKATEQATTTSAGPLARSHNIGMQAAWDSLLKHHEAAYESN